MKLLLQLVALAILPGLLGFLLIQAIWFRRSARNLILRDEITGSKFVEVCESLVAINSSCAEHRFDVKRAGYVMFHRERLTMFWGSVGSVGDGGAGSSGWVRKPGLFALVDGEQGNWLKAYPDVFSPVFSGSPFSVFGVKVSALKANKTLQATAAARHRRAGQLTDL